MGDDKGKGVTETIADEVKGAAVEVYRDTAQPATREVGKTLGNAANLILAPVNAIINGLRAVGAMLASRVGRKLDERVPPERQLAAPATIAGPAAMHYALLGDGEEVAELREMFEDLLVTSMDRETAANAHPAFVGMISQMTPDEAWILKSITRSDYAASDVFEMTLTGKRALGLRTMFGLGIGIDESRQHQYLTNLDRLGILRIEFGDSPTDQTSMEALDQMVTAEFSGRDTFAHGGVIKVTPLGQQFLDTCVKPRRT